MNDIIELIREEWERFVLGAIIVVLVLICGVCVYRYLNREEDMVAVSKPRAELPRYYSIERLTGDQTPKLADKVNPMICVFQKPEPQQRPVLPPPPAVGPKNPPPARQTAGTVKPTAPGPAQPPPKPKKIRTVEMIYHGFMQISGGQSAAQLRVTEVLSEKSRNSFNVRLIDGGKILGGLLEIVSFDTNKVVLRYSGDKQVVLRIREKKRTLKIEVNE